MKHKHHFTRGGSRMVIRCGSCGDVTEANEPTLAEMLAHHASLHDDDDEVDFVVTVDTSATGTETTDG